MSNLTLAATAFSLLCGSPDANVPHVNEITLPVSYAVRDILGNSGSKDTIGNYSGAYTPLSGSYDCSDDMVELCGDYILVPHGENSVVCFKFDENNRCDGITLSNYSDFFEDFKSIGPLWNRRLDSLVNVKTEKELSDKLDEIIEEINTSIKPIDADYLAKLLENKMPMYNEWYYLFISFGVFVLALGILFLCSYIKINKFNEADVSLRENYKDLMGYALRLQCLINAFSIKGQSVYNAENFDKFCKKIGEISKKLYDLSSNLSKLCDKQDYIEKFSDLVSDMHVLLDLSDNFDFKKEIVDLIGKIDVTLKRLEYNM